MSARLFSSRNEGRSITLLVCKVSICKRRQHATATPQAQARIMIIFIWNGPMWRNSSSGHQFTFLRKTGSSGKWLPSFALCFRSCLSLSLLSRARAHTHTHTHINRPSRHSRSSGSFSRTFSRAMEWILLPRHQTLASPLLCYLLVCVYVCVCV